MPPCCRRRRLLRLLHSKCPLGAALVFIHCRFIPPQIKLCKGKRTHHVIEKVSATGKTLPP